jgi:hypothetical protein
MLIAQSLRRAIAAALTASLITGVAACGARPKDSGYLPNPLLISTTEDYTQEASGLQLPTEVATFRRESILQNDAKATDLNVRYRDANQFGGIVAALHVFRPSGREAGVGSDARNIREFESRKNEILRTHQNAKLLAEQAVTLRQNGADQPGRMASFTYEGLYDEQHLPVITRLYVFAPDQGRWLLDYEFMYPADFDADKPIEQFLKSLHWTFKPAA